MKQLEWLDCPVCYMHLDELSCQPKLIYPCGHLCCSQCLSKSTTSKCPECRTTIKRLQVPYHLNPILRTQTERILNRRARNKKRNEKKRQNRKVKMEKAKVEILKLRDRVKELSVKLVNLILKTKDANNTENTDNREVRLFQGQFTSIGSSNIN